MTVARALAVALLAAVVALAGVPAAAQTTGGGSLGPDYVRATLADLGPGTFPGGGLPAAAPDATPPYTWQTSGTGLWCVVFRDGVPPGLADHVSPLSLLQFVPPFGAVVGTFQGWPVGGVAIDDPSLLPADAVNAGRFVFDVGTPSVPGRVLLVVPRCDAAAPAAPPRPPTAAEVWQQTPLPRATVHASPPGTRSWPGITGLESRFWGDPLPDTGASVRLDGWAVDVVAHPVAYAWALPGPVTTVGAGPGSAAAPGVRSTFRRRGDPAVTLYVVWAGLAHVWSPAYGFDLGPEYLGSVTLPVRLAYHVAEIRSVLRTTGSG